MSRVKQGTLTLPDPHPLQGALYCIGCSLAGILYFTHVVCLTIYDIEYRYWICLLVLLFIIVYIYIFQYITHVHFYKNNVKYVDANLDAPDNAISDNESSSEMLTSQSQIRE